ncbi:MAG: hypothetical protein QOE82_1702 [Thermoanaerobaculia bacterium]|jgi:glycosyltransferase involved in cell wall biosynthesis|nr:hypothetical protein [Thermoanaerobaculia bacterium]
MIRTIASVIRGEGLRSAIRRANERIAGGTRFGALRTRAAFTNAAETPILIVAAAGGATRLGGVQAQLQARLREERKLRNVALLTPGALDLSAPARHIRRVASDLVAGIPESVAITGARTIHFEGMSDVPLAAALQLIESGLDVILSVHDFALFCARPHLIEEPMGRFCFYSEDLDRCQRCLRQTWDVPENAQHTHRALARRLLASAKGIIFPSHFLIEKHRQLFSLPLLHAEVIEPAVPIGGRIRRGGSRSIAFAGAARHHKGAHLLPELARLTPDIEMHIFGSGDEELLRAIRRAPNVRVHGYYRSGELPSLLARHGVGLVVLPSIWPEAYCLVLSEAWLAGAAVAAFDLGAQAERIRQHGGGWLAPLESGAAGLAAIVDDWKAGRIATTPPRQISTPGDAARAIVDVYQRLGVS